MCVGRSVGLSSALWKSGGSHPDAVWHHRSDGFRHETGSGVWGSVHGKALNGYFWGEFGARHCPQGPIGRTCATAPRRGPLAKLLRADLFATLRRWVITHTHTHTHTEYTIVRQTATNNGRKLYTLPKPSALLVKSTPRTARAAPRSTAHHGLTAGRSVAAQLLPTFIPTGSLLPSTAFHALYSPYVGK